MKWLFQVIWFWITNIFKNPSKLHAGLAVREVFIRRVNMASVTYRLRFLPSPSNFVEEVQVHGFIGGVPMTPVLGLPSNATQVDIDFPIDSSIEWFTRTIGDNGTQADSNHRTFTATNLEQVQPGMATGEDFVKFNV